ncbi:site-specific integrase [Actinosynnema pretiosum]
MRLHVYPHLGHIPMNQIVSKNIRAWVKSRESVLAPTSIHTIYSYLKSIFNTAVSDRVISVSPCTRIRLPEIERNKYWIPSPRQVAELHKAMNERYRAAVYIAAGCGLRLCEIFGLERDDIDFERREIHVRQQIKRVRGEVYVGPPKTKTSKRTVELPRVVERVLIEHLENFPSTPVKMRENNGKNKRVRSFDLVFTSARGQAVTGGHWGGPWRAARASVAGVPDNFGIHGLRHYFATLLIHCGASVKTVQAALGHASPITTLNVYAHEWPEAVDRTRNLVDSALGEDFELDQPIADNAQPGELTADVQVA